MPQLYRDNFAESDGKCILGGAKFREYSFELPQTWDSLAPNKEVLMMPRLLLKF